LFLPRSGWKTIELQIWVRKNIHTGIFWELVFFRTQFKSVVQGIPETQVDFLIQSLELKWQTGKKAGLVERAQKAFQESIFNSF
jgi:hypothetical protein